MTSAVGGMVGWSGVFLVGERPAGIHPWASVGGPPEHRGWMVGDDMVAPEIANSALIHAFCTVDAGMTYKPTTSIGERTFLQARVHVGHNAVIGADCEICAGVVLGGEVTIGDGVRIGGNSWVKPLVVIGDGVIIGGNATVTRDVPAHEVWAGTPARRMKLAWTHPDYRPEGEYAPTRAAWEAAHDSGGELEQRQRAAKMGRLRDSYPTVEEILEHEVLHRAPWDPGHPYKEPAGHGFGVDGDFA